MFKKLRQKIANRKLEHERKEREILLNSFESVLSYTEYTKVTFAKSTANPQLSKYAKLTTEGDVSVITKDKQGKTMSLTNVDIETFAKNYSL